jgi:hypothetical protein
VAETWGVRRRFVTELQRISSVAEFDPVDFSYASVSLRLTRDKVFILAMVDLRLPPLFPAAPALLLIHDLLSGASFPLPLPLDSKSNTQSNKVQSKRRGGGVSIASGSFFCPLWTPERMAREYFWALCQEVQDLAFGASKTPSDAY